MNDEILILALGNDILGDDGAGPESGRILQQYYGSDCQIEIVCGGGLELLDLLEGKKKVLIIDSICSGDIVPGAIKELSIPDFSRLVAFSPHYVGLPEIIHLAGLLGINFPQEIKILAIEIMPQLRLSEQMSKEINRALPNLVKSAIRILKEWESELMFPIQKQGKNKGAENG